MLHTRTENSGSGSLEFRRIGLGLCGRIGRGRREVG